MKNIAITILLFSLAGMISCKAGKKSTPNYGSLKSNQGQRIQIL
jgi:hypothetical protein